MNYVLYDHKRDMVTEIGVPQKKKACNNQSIKQAWFRGGG